MTTEYESAFVPSPDGLVLEYVPISITRAKTREDPCKTAHILAEMRVAAAQDRVRR